MSFPVGKRPFHSSSLAVLLIISVLCLTTAVAAIRIFPQRIAAAVEEEGGGQPMEAAPPGKIYNQTEIFREYFKSRLSDLNSTTNDTFVDSKRRIPSCPDPLHN